MKKERLVEYREFNTSLVKDEDNKMILEGFIPFNERSSDLGGFVEVITPSAFKKSVKERDILALFSHDTKQVLGRTKNGSLVLDLREDGLYCKCTLPETTYAKDVYNLVRNSYSNQMSFGFSVISDTWEDDDGIAVRYLREVILYEISFAVGIPAYPGTTSNVRSLLKINPEEISEGLNELNEIELDRLANINTELNNFFKREKSDNSDTEIKEAAGTSTSSELSTDYQFYKDFLENLRNI